MALALPEARPHIRITLTRIPLGPDSRQGARPHLDSPVLVPCDERDSIPAHSGMHGHDESGARPSFFTWCVVDRGVDADQARDEVNVDLASEQYSQVRTSSESARFGSASIPCFSLSSLGIGASANLQKLSELESSSRATFGSEEPRGRS